MYKKQWQKLLYKAQPFPDNYVPASFLDQLKTNSNVRLYPFRKVSLEACGILQQLSCITIFFGIFVNCHAGIWKVTDVTAVSAAIVVIGTLGWARGIEKLAKEQERLLQAQLGADRQRSYSSNIINQRNSSTRSSISNSLEEAKKDVPLEEFKTPLIAGTINTNISPPYITSKIITTQQVATPQASRVPFNATITPTTQRIPLNNLEQPRNAITSKDNESSTHTSKQTYIPPKLIRTQIASTPELFRRPAWEMSCKRLVRIL
jgi:hypothetical protein